MNEFLEKMEQLSDENLKEVLKSKSGYREEAYIAATQVAINRGIIKSDADLETEEYRELKKETRFQLFPIPHKKEQQQKVRRSLYRSLLIVGIIPLIYFTKELIDDQSTIQWQSLMFSTIWLLSLLLSKLKKNANFLITIPALLIAGIIFLAQNYLVLSDIIVLSIMSLVVTYTTLFLGKIIKTKC